ncbi:MAG: efflux RND transporter periplasmic adaptor subunit [Porticoccaceae bacterium]|nr:efflux RND transporter periplasmic adaptor subunit [Porticoccaceae bacterium]
MWKAPQVEEQADTAENRRTLVTAQWFQAQPYASQFSARGRTEPNRAVNLRAEVSGRVIAVPAERGQRVAAGDVVCHLAVEDRQQRVNEANAALKEAQLRFQGVSKLKQQGLQSELAIAEAKSGLERARADLKKRQLDLQNTEIRAPFAGVVETRPVEVGDFMNRGDSCAQLLEISPLKVVAQVSEQQVQQISLGSPAQVQLVDGSQAAGEVIFLGQQASAATRTYRIEATIDNADNRLRAGLTAQFVVSSRELLAQRIPSSVLGLGDSGEIGVRLLDDDKRVQFQEIQIVGDDAGGVWVLGLPQDALLITVGQEYVTSGEQVEVKIVGGGAEVAGGETAAVESPTP